MADYAYNEIRRLRLELRIMKQSRGIPLIEEDMR
jgi:hypothetical protein